MSKLKRIREKVKSVYVGIEDFSGKIDKIKSQLDEIRKICVDNGYFEDSVEINIIHYYESVDIDVVAERLETEKEKTIRLAKAKKEREKKKKLIEEQEDKELAQLMKLAEKFGKTVS